MKKNVLAFVLLFAAFVSLTTKSNGQTALVHYWNFNVDTPAAMNPTVSLVAGASLSYSGAYYDTVQQGTILNGAGADGTALTASSAALRLRNPAGPFIMTLPATGYRHIMLAYAEQRTKKGAQQNTVTYSTDGGASWINTAIAATATYFVDSTDTISNTPYQLETFDFSSDTMVSNNGNFKVRIVFSMGDTNSSGNNRFDNITVMGDSIPGVTGVLNVANASPAFNLHPNPATDGIEISANAAGDKTIIITNELGQNVYTGAASGKLVVVNTSRFATGNYFVKIREQKTGDVTTLRFVKQ